MTATPSNHTVEKIGGTSMSDYASIRDNIFLNAGSNGTVYRRIFVVSAYGGMTDLLLEHKKTGQAGVYSMFASAEKPDNWRELFAELEKKTRGINATLFTEGALIKANSFIQGRLDDAKRVLHDLQQLCSHGHFSLNDHLQTVREMLASLGEIHSAHNTAQLLQQENVNALFIDLSGWHSKTHLSLDAQIEQAFKNIDVETQMPIVTGYCHCTGGLMAMFDRGYSEMIFSRVAVLTGAREAIIHKEFHLSSADPRLVGENKAVPIGRTNYDVADQLANLGMEAIHPKAAKGLRQNNIYLRVKNAFEPEHGGTLITNDYISEIPRVEIIAGRQNVYAFELFDQDMVGDSSGYGLKVLEQIIKYDAPVVNKDLNANTLTYYLATSLEIVTHIEKALQKLFPDAEITIRKVCVVSAIGSHMKIPGILAKTAAALAEVNVSILALHQSMRQVDMQFILDEADYDIAVKSLHAYLVENA